MLGRYLERSALEASACHFFPQRPVLSFRPARERCRRCRVPLRVFKTKTKTVHTLALGSFTAHETLLRCPRCRKIHACEDLRRLAPSGCRFGYEVMSFAGTALFLRHRTVAETAQELARRNVRISKSEVAHLAQKFVVYLALAHRQCAPRLNELLRGSGGYVLHLDGTCEGGSPVLMSTFDSLSQLVLGSSKLPSEKADQIVPLLNRIKARHGIPKAIVHDMGTGIRKAVEQVFPGVPDFVCHFHFLRDAGKDLLQTDYDAIRLALRRHAFTEKLKKLSRRLKAAIDREPGLVDGFCQSLHDCSAKKATGSLPLVCAYGLIEWVLGGQTQGDGCGFPFDRPHLDFAKRALLASQNLDSLADVPLHGPWMQSRPLFQLSWDLKALREDPCLQKAIASIEAKIELFDRLRRAMRIADAGGRGGLNSGDKPPPIGPIKKAVTAFRRDLGARPDFATSPHWKTLADQIDRHSDKLFADPLVLHTPSGPRLLQPQRTNNVLERFFRDFRRSFRRRTGKNSIGAFLQSMIAETPLVKNLDNPLYLHALLGGQPSLEHRFAQIDAQLVRSELLAARNAPEKVPAKIHRLIASDQFLPAVCNLFRKIA